MFYNGRKTIGVFLNRAELEFQQVLSKSLTKTAKECDYNIVFLTSFGIRETETMYDLYEKNVVDFAPIEDFDAIIVALDTYDTPSFREKLIEGLHSRAHCPVISFREAAYEFFFYDEQHRPDAIVCANDFMARALTSTLQMHGIRVPQDVPARILYRESTRNFAVCEDKERNEIFWKLNEVLEKHSRQSFFSTDMDGCADYEEMKQIACKNLRLLGNCKEFYLGLLGEENGDIRQFQSDITPFAKLGMGVYEGSLLGVPDMSLC